MIYLFNHSEELVGELLTDHLIAADQEEVLNGLERLDFSVPIEDMDKLEGVEFVVHKSATDPNSFIGYRLVSAQNTARTIEYTAINVAYDELQRYGYLREYRMTDTTAGLALDRILHGSRWRPGFVEETRQGDLYIYDLSRLEALSDLVDVWGVELRFRLVIDGNKIVDRFVDLYHEMGIDTHERFSYGHKALQVVREEDRKDIVTALIGRGKGEEKYDEYGNPTGGFGRRINFREVEWSKANGDPLDKPLGEEILEDPDATARYGFSDGAPRVEIYTRDQIDDPSDLLQATYDELVRRSRPQVHFKSTLAKLGAVGLGDKVGIIRKDLNIYYTARVFKIKRNLLDPDDAQVELGDNLAYGAGDRERENRNNLKSLGGRIDELGESTSFAFTAVIEEMREGLKQSYFNEDGFNYEFKTGNEYNLPAGYYSFDRPIDQDPAKVIYFGAGMMAIANKKDPAGQWDWRTFGTGDGLMAETIVGTLGEFARVNANQVTVSNDFAQTDLGKKVVVQDELYNNVKITGAKGLQVLDANQQERVQLGNWAAGRYGLKLTNPSGTRTVLDDKGIMQSWQVDKTDNLDSQYPATMNLYLPPHTTEVFSASLNIYVSSFRAHSRSASYGGSQSTTSQSGGSQYVSESSGSGGYTQNSATSTVERWTQSGRGHNHGVPHGTPILDGDGIGLAFFAQSGDHNHDFTYTAPSHTHSVSFSIPSHTHPVTIPGHSHGIGYGIYEEWGGASLTLYINGVNRTAALTGSSSFQVSLTSLQVGPYLSSGQWNTIQIQATARARVDLSVFVQTLMSYPNY